MSEARLNVAVWSAGLWLCGWAMHDDMIRTGQVSPVSILIVVLMWAHVNVEASHV